MRHKPLALIPFALLLVFIGAMTKQQTISKPSMESARGVDIVSLTGSGFCLGIAFGFLVMALASWVRRPAESRDVGK